VRDETKRGMEAVAVSLVVGTLHLALVSERFAEPRGGGGFTMLVGCTFVTAVLWAMLALRTIANDGPVAPEIDDGLVSVAVTGWVMALLPARPSNFLSEGQTDDFAWVYVPLSLFAVFAVLAAQKLWPLRSTWFLFVRLLASASASALFVAAMLVFVSRGDGAAEVAVRAVVLAVLAAIATFVLWAKARRAGVSG